MNSELKNNARGTIVIAGGAGYVGSAIVKVLQDAGFAVVIVKRGDSVADIAAQHSEVLAVVYAASAPLVRGPLLVQSDEEFASQFSVNVTGAFNFFKVFCPRVIKGGAVIGITTKALSAGERYTPMGSYLPAKYALQGILRVLANELNGRSIGVYAVAPAFMAGGLNDDLPQAVSEFITKKSAPEDITNPKEVAELVLDIVEGKAENMSGKSITVPGRAVSDL